MSQPGVEISSDEAEFEPLKGFENDYEIQTTYPYNIKKKSNNRIIKEGIHHSGYVYISLNGKYYNKHVIVARQFIENPDNLPQVDHINHDKADYHLSNLRYVSSSENNKNKSSHNGIQAVYVDDIPNDAMIIDFYETRTERREFEENKYYYYFDETNNEDKFYAKITENIYKVLHHNIAKSGNEFVSLRDINNRQVGLMINRFKHQHDLI